MPFLFSHFISCSESRLFIKVFVYLFFVFIFLLFFFQNFLFTKYKSQKTLSKATFFILFFPFFFRYSKRRSRYKWSQNLWFVCNRLFFVYFILISIFILHFIISIFCNFLLNVRCLITNFFQLYYLTFFIQISSNLLPPDWLPFTNSHRGCVICRPPQEQCDSMRNAHALQGQRHFLKRRLWMGDRRFFERPLKKWRAGQATN